MKIGPSADNSMQVQSGGTSASQKTAQSTSPAANSSATQGARSAGVAVTVSNLARGLEKAGRGDAAVVDTQKVANIRAAIQQGTYVVNPEAIADKLLSNAQEMLNRTTR